MVNYIDLNADIGEADNQAWAESEAAILAHISSANIACGGHAGDQGIMTTTSHNAKTHNVIIGAHPSYPDRKNFGRLELKLGEDISAADLSESLYRQICTLLDITQGDVKYVKPHGALYNQAVNTPALADLLGDVIIRINAPLSWLGGPKSQMTLAAQVRNIPFIAEGFIDRQYSDDGHLVSRKLDGAVITTNEARLKQALSLAKDQSVVSRSGAKLDITAGSLCLHGDSKGAVETARITRAALEADGLEIRAFCS
ncbi:MAG: 5-oxoprolinase subunit PxpA [Maricaulaceae bacterium]